MSTNDLNHITTHTDKTLFDLSFAAASTSSSGLVPQDIKKINKSLEEANNGFLLSFPPPPSGSLPPQDIYRYDFDIAYRLPLNPLSAVTFTPNLPDNPDKASYLSSSINTNINIGISIRSIHKAETQTLVRLRIKNIYNTILYTDYILVVSSPKRQLTLKGSIVPTGTSESIGPNGGRILRLDTTTTSEAAAQLFRSMQVTGPGIPENSIVTIRSFIQDNRFDIELLPFFDQVAGTGNYTFTLVSNCLSAEDLEQIKFSNRYIVLNSTNNWSFYFQDRFVIKFIPRSDLNPNEVSVLVDIKNFDVLLGADSSLSIPSMSYLYGKGRVFNDNICIKSL